MANGCQERSEVKALREATESAVAACWRLAEAFGLVEDLPEPPMPDPAREAAERRVEEWINGERECL